MMLCSGESGGGEYGLFSRFAFAFLVCFLAGAALFFACRLRVFKGDAFRAGIGAVNIMANPSGMQHTQNSCGPLNIRFR